MWGGMTGCDAGGSAPHACGTSRRNSDVRHVRGGGRSARGMAFSVRYCCKVSSSSRLVAVPEWRASAPWRRPRPPLSPPASSPPAAALPHNFPKPHSRSSPLRWKGHLGSSEPNPLSRERERVAGAARQCCARPAVDLAAKPSGDIPKAISAYVATPIELPWQDSPRAAFRQPIPARAKWKRLASWDSPPRSKTCSTDATGAREGRAWGQRPLAPPPPPPPPLPPPAAGRLPTPT